MASCPCATLLACRLWRLQLQLPLPLPLPLARLAHCNIRFRFRCAACPAPFSLSLSLSLSPPLCSSLPLACVCRQLNFDLDCRLPMSQSENCCQLISDDWQPCWQFWQFWSQIRSMSRCLISNANNRHHRKTYIQGTQSLWQFELPRHFALRIYLRRLLTSVKQKVATISFSFVRFASVAQR